MTQAYALQPPRLAPLPPPPPPALADLMAQANATLGRRFPEAVAVMFTASFHALFSLVLPLLTVDLKIPGTPQEIFLIAWVVALYGIASIPVVLVLGLVTGLVARLSPWKCPTWGIGVASLLTWGGALYAIWLLVE